MKEQTSSPKLTKEQILFALDKFRKLDLTIEANKERLIDSLVKCVLLYDDKLVITFNFKNEPVTVPTSEEFAEIEKSSDIKAFASPGKTGRHPQGVPACRAKKNISCAQMRGAILNRKFYKREFGDSGLNPN